MALRRIYHAIEVPAPPGTTRIERQLRNEELLPVPEEKRKWSGRSYTSFWIADSMNLNTFSIASSGIIAGLSWWQALIATAIGYGLAAPFLCLNGRPGAVFHVKFPIISRAAFGIWGSYWVVINRVVMSAVWHGVQSWLGGECVSVLLQAIWPSYANLRNTMEGSGTTTKAWIGFFIFWLLTLLTLWPPIEKARYFFYVKAIVAPVGGFTFMIWTLVRAHGGGSVIHEKATLSGTALAWPMITAIMSCMANMATLITNNPDITSYADKPSAVLLPQLVTLPLGFTITGLVGILIASGSKAIYGHVIWDPIEHLGTILEGSPSHGERFGCAFIAICFIYVQLIMNLSGNSIGFACDSTALLPQFLTIRRGGYICACISLAYCPWKLFASSSTFTTYLSAYSVLLSSVVGVMLCEYYIIRRGRVRVADFYTNHRDGWYWYTGGFNIRAYVAYLAGVAPNLPGLANSVTSKNLTGVGATHVYDLSWFVGLGIAMVVYYVLNRIWPSQGAFPTGFYEEDLSQYEEDGLGQFHVGKTTKLSNTEVARDRELQESDGAVDSSEKDVELGKKEDDAKLSVVELV